MRLWLLALGVLIPVTVFASVSVVDVMYDAPGKDTGREWVEFTTDSPITDVRTWRFVEGGVKHKITGESGAVPAGSTFVLAADAAAFRAEHPEFTGLVFDTAMSLNNSGETIALIDGAGVTALTHAYVAAPKPKAEPEPKPAKTAKQKPEAEPRVLGASTGAQEEPTSPTLVERGQLVAAAIESPSREFAWVSLALLAIIVVGGLGTLIFLGRQ